MTASTTAPGRDRVVCVGWRVPADYRGLPTVRHTVTDWGEPVAEVRSVVLSAPAWCKLGTG